MGSRQAADGPSATAARRLEPREFVARFEGSARQLWCIAVAVLGDRALAEDVVQESAMIALQKLDQFDADTSFIAWMGRIVRFTALNQSRRRQRINAVETPAVEVDRISVSSARSEGGGVSSRGEITDAEQVFDDQVLRVLNTLDANARACLLLRIVHGLPYAEISLALDLPEGTVMSHVHRARKTMRDRLTESSETERASHA